MRPDILSLLGRISQTRQLIINNIDLIPTEELVMLLDKLGRDLVILEINFFSEDYHYNEK